MALNMDPRQPVKQTVGSAAPSHQWIRGLPTVDGGQFAEPALREDSYLSECECPNDCLRDHENE